MAGCNIQFQNNPLKIYYAGQTIMGRAILAIHNIINVRGVFVRIEGKSYCSFHAYSRRSYIVREQLHFTETANLIGNREGIFELMPDTYEFGFQWNLPHLLPTSLEGVHGYIRYTVKIVIDRPFWPNIVFTEAFTVLKPLNLNLDPIHSRPQFLTDKKTYNLLCCWCCCVKSGKLTITGQLPQIGYVPGQLIDISVKVSNKSNKDVECHALLIKIISYIGRQNYKGEEVILTDKILGRCPINSVQDFNGNVSVPSVPPTDLHTSSICKVRYELRIKGETDVCCGYDLVLTTPIVLGTYPIIQQQGRHIFDNKLSIPYSPDIHVPPPSSPFEKTSPTAPHINGLDLPTYEPAVGDASKIEDGPDYIPYYLVYKSAPIPRGSSN